MQNKLQELGIKVGKALAEPVKRNWKNGKKVKAGLIVYLYLGVVIGTPISYFSGSYKQPAVHSTVTAEETVKEEVPEVETPRVETPRVEKTKVELLADAVKSALNNKEDKQAVEVLERAKGVYEIHLKAHENFNANLVTVGMFGQYKDVCEELKEADLLKEDEGIIVFWNGELVDGNGNVFECTWAKVGIDGKTLKEINYDLVTSDSVVKASNYKWLRESIAVDLDSSDTYGFLKGIEY